MQAIHTISIFYLVQLNTYFSLSFPPNLRLVAAFCRDEAEVIFINIYHLEDRPCPWQVDDTVQNGSLPIGKVKARSKRLLVFPNTHVYRLEGLKNIPSRTRTEIKEYLSTSPKSKMRTVVFHKLIQKGGLLPLVKFLFNKIIAEVN